MGCVNSQTPSSARKFLRGIYYHSPPLINLPPTSLNGHPVQIVCDATTCPVTAQEWQETPQQQLQAVVVDLEPSIEATLSRGARRELKVELSDAGNEIRKELGPADGPAMELQNVPQRAALVNDAVQFDDVRVAKVPSPESKVGHCVHRTIEQRIAVPRPARRDTDKSSGRLTDNV